MKTYEIPTWIPIVGMLNFVILVVCCIRIGTPENNLAMTLGLAAFGYTSCRLSDIDAQLKWQREQTK